MAIVEEDRPEAVEIASPAAKPTWTSVLHEWVVTVDHKKIGIMYVIMAIVFLVIGGCEAELMRLQLWVPRNGLIKPDFFNQLFTMHGTTMVFFMGMPILIGMGNYLVPLMIGARDMAFPRLNALGFWATLFGGLLVYFSFVTGGAPAIGWFALAPLTETHVCSQRRHRFLGAGADRQRHRHGCRPGSISWPRFWGCALRGCRCAKSRFCLDDVMDGGADSCRVAAADRGAGDGAV